MRKEGEETQVRQRYLSSGVDELRVKLLTPVGHHLFKGCKEEEQR